MIDYHLTKKIDARTAETEDHDLKTTTSSRKVCSRGMSTRAWNAC